LARVWKVGVPSGVEQVLVQLAFTTMAAMLARLGAAAYAANQITNWLAALAYLPGWGIAVAVVTLVGQELGARRLHEVKRSVRLGLVLAVLTNTALGVLLVLFSGWLLPIFNSDPEVLASGLGAMKLAALIQPIMAAAFIYTSALTGAGETQRVMLIGVCSAWLVRLTIAYLAGSVLGLGLAGFWIAIGADYACRAILAYASFRLGTWQTARPF
jgi:Na+-driven multidrug efflux pump